MVISVAWHCPPVFNKCVIVPSAQYETDPKPTIASVVAPFPDPYPCIHRSGLTMTCHKRNEDLTFQGHRHTTWCEITPIVMERKLTYTSSVCVRDLLPGSGLRRVGSNTA